jgi:hypothetical protein
VISPPERSNKFFEVPDERKAEKKL